MNGSVQEPFKCMFYSFEKNEFKVEVQYFFPLKASD